MNLRMQPAVAIALLLWSATSFANGDVERGREKSQVCQACHGPDGNGVGDPQYPTLAGQYTDYLSHAMKAYKTGERANVIMRGFMQTLSEQDIEDLAAFYAGQDSKLHDLSHLD